MTPSASAPRANWRLISLAIVAAVTLLVIGANVHLVYVAFSSQPSCVPHVKADDQGGVGGFRAARSAC